MSAGYNNIPIYTSPFTAIRSGLGRIGFGDVMQTLEPDLIAWVAEAQDKISRLKTFTDLPCELEVCDNKVMLPQEMQLIECASFNGSEMTNINNPGCCDRLTKNSPNRCCRSAQGFYLDECYMHFKPFLPDGCIVHVDGRQRPIGTDGYPLVAEVCITAVAEYIATMVSLRFRDNRYNEFNKRWKLACKQARAELTRLSQAQIESLGYIYHRVQYPATFGVTNLNGGYLGN